jgi:hypothetical protein
MEAMTDKTPEQTLRDLLALGEKADQWDEDDCVTFGLKSADALPALRSLIEEVEGLRPVACTAMAYVAARDEYMLTAPEDDSADWEELEMRLDLAKQDYESALSRIQGGK